jgi:hypothetical protein
MFISTRPILNEYCEWLFPKLQVYDNFIGLTGANGRIDGYLAEHIFGFWIRERGLRNYTATKVEVHYLPVSGAKA